MGLATKNGEKWWINRETVFETLRFIYQNRLKHVGFRYGEWNVGLHEDGEYPQNIAIFTRQLMIQH